MSWRARSSSPGSRRSSAWSVSYTHLKVIGVGGGGGNAVTHMVASGIDGVDFMCINTDAQALKHSKVKTCLLYTSRCV